MAEMESTAIERSDRERIDALEQRVEALEKQRAVAEEVELERKRDHALVYNWMRVVAQRSGISALFDRVEAEVVERFGKEFGTLPGPLTIEFNVQPVSDVRDLVTRPDNGKPKRPKRNPPKKRRR